MLYLFTRKTLLNQMNRFKVNKLDLTLLKKKINEGNYASKLRKITGNEKEINIIDCGLYKDPIVDNTQEEYSEDEFETYSDDQFEDSDDDILNTGFDVSVDKFRILDVLRVRLEILEDNLKKVNFFYNTE